MSHELTGWARARPLRIAFLIEDGDHANSALDGIFADCYSRWGGRFSLIVPCVNGRIMADYWAWLEVYDPDVVYSYVPLGKTEILELHERICPAEYIFHSLSGETRRDVFAVKPSYQAAPLSSMSTVFTLARFSAQPGWGGRVRIIDSWHTEAPTRLLTDNLGIYQHSRGSSIFPSDALSAATLLTVVSPSFQVDRRFAVPSNLEIVESEMAAFREFVGKRATALSVVSAQLTPRLNVAAGLWSESFSLVVGESFGDRVMFWNARLLIPDWLDNDICCFRVGLEQLKSPEFLAVLGDLLKQRNHVVRGSGNQPQITVRSISHSAEDLAEACTLLQSTNPWGAVTVESVSGLERVAPSPAALQSAREGNRTGSGLFVRPNWTRFKWTHPVAHLPPMVPDHLLDAPVRQAFTSGYWCTDLSLQYDGPGSRFTDENSWVLPRRWRMAGAFKAASSNQSHLAAPPRVRRSRSGNLAVFSCTDLPVETVSVPTVYEAFQYALAADGIWSQPEAEHGRVTPQNKVYWTDPSNEARYLAGVLGMAGGLQRAGQFLLHPFLREQFTRLGGTPRLPSEQVAVTANRLQKIARRQPTFDLKNDAERGALAELIAKAARTIKNPMEFLRYEELTRDWKTYRAAYWVANPQHGDTDTSVDWDLHEAASLDACLVEMRRRQMIFQGHRWTCRNCHHRNWVGFDALSSELACEVCKQPTSAPLDIRWLFRPSEFLIESLRDHSTLSLIWTLSALRQRARRSFMFVGPTCFGFSRDSENPDAEADLLVVVDGESILCEVKSSWNSLRATDILNLVDVAKRLRPEIALLAVMEAGTGPDEQIKSAKEALAVADIEFRLLTCDAYKVEDEPYLRFDETG